MTTGYFADDNGRRGKVHLVIGQSAACGRRTAPIYQECGNGVHENMIECRLCLAIVSKLPTHCGGSGRHRAMAER